MTSVIWIPPDNGDPITFGPDSPYKLHAAENLLSVQATPQTRRAPGQYGATYTDAQIDPRVIALNVRIETTSREDAWEMRERLARALVTLPSRQGTPQAGLLRLFRRGTLPVVELPAIPRNSPQEAMLAPGVIASDIEFLCPNPFWRSITDHTEHMGAQSGGLAYPKSYPKSYDSQNVTVDIAYGGSVPAPPVFRIYGELTTPRMRNMTTGEVIEVTGLIPAGEFVEIQTAFGQKSIEHVTAAGVRTSIMHRLNLNRADFWHLQPGLNTVTFEADSNVSGEAYVTYREWFGGI